MKCFSAPKARADARLSCACAGRCRKRHANMDVTASWSVTARRRTRAGGVKGRWWHNKREEGATDTAAEQQQQAAAPGSDRRARHTDWRGTRRTNASKHQHATHDQARPRAHGAAWWAGQSTDGTPPTKPTSARPPLLPPAPLDDDCARLRSLPPLVLHCCFTPCAWRRAACQARRRRANTLRPRARALRPRAWPGRRCRPTSHRKRQS